MSEEAEGRFSFSDQLALALACVGGILALVLVLVDKTPLTVGLMLLGIALLSIYPVLHFVHGRWPRIVSLLVTAVLVGGLGWGTWPKKPESASKPELLAPAITWNDPAPIQEGTQLSEKQLNAKSSVGGSFSYIPDIGTILAVGTHNLTVVFTPADTSKYSASRGTTQIVVVPAAAPKPSPPTVSARDNSKSTPSVRSAPAVLPDVPQISASFVQLTSPGVLVQNRYKSVIKDPSCAVSMWNLDRKPLGSMPEVNQNNPGQFIKQNGSLLLATIDTPSTKPYVTMGDRVFGFVTVDCPDCKAERQYWLYFIYGNPTESWFSEIPENTNVNLFSVQKLLVESDGNIDLFMTKVAHGARLPLEKIPLQ